MTTATLAVNTVNPSINLAALNVPASVVVSNTTPAVQASSAEQLKSLETARITWETTELAQSNNRLYSILQQAYSFYLVMKQDESKDVRKEKQAALDAFIEEHGYTNSFGATTHDMTRVIKCVFGVNRRRVSAYSIALREALRQEVGAKDLIAFLEQNGGVEQIRMGGTKPLSATKRAELVKAEVSEAVISTVKFDAEAIKANADWVDKQVVFVATYLPTGEFEVNAVVRHDGAVNNALAAYYTLAQAKKREEANALKKAEADAIAAQKSEAKEAAKSEDKTAKQIAKTAKEVAETAEQAKAIDAFDNVFVTEAQATEQLQAELA
jgi:phage-related protein